MISLRCGEGARTHTRTQKISDLTMTSELDGMLPMTSSQRIPPICPCPDTTIYIDAVFKIKFKHLDQNMINKKRYMSICIV